MLIPVNVKYKIHRNVKLLTKIHAVEIGNAWSLWLSHPYVFIASQLYLTVGCGVGNRVFATILLYQMSVEHFVELQLAGTTLILSEILLCGKVFTCRHIRNDRGSNPDFGGGNEATSRTSRALPCVLVSSCRRSISVREDPMQTS
jgi:hypothetical protein